MHVRLALQKHTVSPPSRAEAVCCLTSPVCVQGLGYSILSTGGTGKHLKANGVDCEVVLKIQEGRPNIGDLVKNGEVAMMLITSTGGCTATSSLRLCSPLHLLIGHLAGSSWRVFEAHCALSVN